MTQNPQDPQNPGNQPAESPEGEVPPSSEPTQPQAPEQPSVTPPEPPAQPSFGSVVPPPPDQQGSGAQQPPSYGSSSTPPVPPPPPQQQPGYGVPPQQQGYGAPEQPGFGSSSTPPVPPPPPQQQPGYGAPQQQPGYGAPQQQPGYGAPQQQPGYGAPQQPPSYGSSSTPPPPGYGTPQQQPGGFPAAPPPPGSYGQYGAPGYGGPSGPGGAWGAPPTFSAGGATGWAFRAYGSNVGYWLLWMLGLLVVGAILAFIFLPAIRGGMGDTGFAAQYDYMNMSFTERLLQAVYALILTALGLVLIQGALHKASGRLSSIGDFVKFDHFGPGLIAAVVVGLITNVLSLVPLVGGLLQLVATVLLIFVVPLALDKGVGIGDALSQGVKLVTGNLGQVIVLWLIFIGLAIAGAIIICGTGLLFVVIPVISLATVFAYKVLSGQQVAAP